MSASHDLFARITATVDALTDEQVAHLSLANAGMSRRRQDRRDCARFTVEKLDREVMSEARWAFYAGYKQDEYRFGYLTGTQGEHAMRWRGVQSVLWATLFFGTMAAVPVTYFLALNHVVDFRTFFTVLGAAAVIIPAAGYAWFLTNFPPRRATIEGMTEATLTIWRLTADVHAAALIRGTDHGNSLRDELRRLEEPWVRAHMPLPARRAVARPQEKF